MKKALAIIKTLIVSVVLLYLPQIKSTVPPLTVIGLDEYFLAYHLDPTTGLLAIQSKELENLYYLKNKIKSDEEQEAEKKSKSSPFDPSQSKIQCLIDKFFSLLPATQEFRFSNAVSSIAKYIQNAPEFVGILISYIENNWDNLKAGNITTTKFTNEIFKKISKEEEPNEINELKKQIDEKNKQIDEHKKNISKLSGEIKNLNPNSEDFKKITKQKLEQIDTNKKLSQEVKELTNKLKEQEKQIKLQKKETPKTPEQKLEELLNSKTISSVGVEIVNFLKALTKDLTEKETLFEKTKNEQKIENKENDDLKKIEEIIKGLYKNIYAFALLLSCSPSKVPTTGSVEEYLQGAKENVKKIFASLDEKKINETIKTGLEGICEAIILFYKNYNSGAASIFDKGFDQYIIHRILLGWLWLKSEALPIESASSEKIEKIEKAEQKTFSSRKYFLNYLKILNDNLSEEKKKSLLKYSDNIFDTTSSAFKDFIKPPPFTKEKLQELAKNIGIKSSYKDNVRYLLGKIHLNYYPTKPYSHDVIIKQRFKPTFAPCAEVALKTFVDMIVFSCSKERTFDSQLPTKLNASKPLIDFYNKYKEESSAASQDASNDWADMCSSLEGITYVKGWYELETDIGTALKVVATLFNLDKSKSPKEIFDDLATKLKTFANIELTHKIEGTSTLYPTVKITIKKEDLEKKPIILEGSWSFTQPHASFKYSHDEKVEDTHILSVIEDKQTTNDVRLKYYPLVFNREAFRSLIDWIFATYPPQPGNYSFIYPLLFLLDLNLKKYDLCTEFWKKQFEKNENANTFMRQIFFSMSTSQRWKTMEDFITKNIQYDFLKEYSHSILDSFYEEEDSFYVIASSIIEHKKSNLYELMPKVINRFLKNNVETLGYVAKLGMDILSSEDINQLVNNLNPINTIVKTIIQNTKDFTREYVTILGTTIQKCTGKDNENVKTFISPFVNALNTFITKIPESINTQEEAALFISFIKNIVKHDYKTLDTSITNCLDKINNAFSTTKNIGILIDYVNNMVQEVDDATSLKDFVKPSIVNVFARVEKIKDVTKELNTNAYLILWNLLENISAKKSYSPDFQTYLNQSSKILFDGYQVYLKDILPSKMLDYTLNIIKNSISAEQDIVFDKNFLSIKSVAIKSADKDKIVDHLLSLSALPSKASKEILFDLIITDICSNDSFKNADVLLDILTSIIARKQNDINTYFYIKMLEQVDRFASENTIEKLFNTLIRLGSKIYEAIESSYNGRPELLNILKNIFDRLKTIIDNIKLENITQNHADLLYNYISLYGRVTANPYSSKMQDEMIKLNPVKLVAARINALCCTITKNLDNNQAIEDLLLGTLKITPFCYGYVQEVKNACQTYFEAVYNVLENTKNLKDLITPKSFSSLWLLLDCFADTAIDVSLFSKYVNLLGPLLYDLYSNNANVIPPQKILNYVTKIVRKNKLDNQNVAAIINFLNMVNISLSSNDLQSMAIMDDTDNLYKLSSFINVCLISGIKALPTNNEYQEITKNLITNISKKLVDPKYNVRILTLAEGLIRSVYTYLEFPDRALYTMEDLKDKDLSALDMLYNVIEPLLPKNITLMEQLDNQETISRFFINSTNLAETALIQNLAPSFVEYLKTIAKNDTFVKNLNNNALEGLFIHFLHAINLQLNKNEQAETATKVNQYWEIVKTIMKYYTYNERSTANTICNNLFEIVEKLLLKDTSSYNVLIANIIDSFCKHPNLKNYVVKLHDMSSDGPFYKVIEKLFTINELKQSCAQLIDAILDVYAISKNYINDYECKFFDTLLQKMISAKYDEKLIEKLLTTMQKRVNDLGKKELLQLLEHDYILRQKDTYLNDIQQVISQLDMREKAINLETIFTMSNNEKQNISKFLPWLLPQDIKDFNVDLIMGLYWYKNAKTFNLILDHITDLYNQKPLSIDDLKQLVTNIFEAIKYLSDTDGASVIIEGLFTILVDKITPEIFKTGQEILFEESIFDANKTYLESFVQKLNDRIERTENSFAKQYLPAAIAFALKEDKPEIWKEYIKHAHETPSYSITKSEAFVLAHFIEWLTKKGTEVESLGIIINLCIKNAPLIAKNSTFSNILIETLESMIKESNVQLDPLFKLLQISGMEYNDKTKKSIFNSIRNLQKEPSKMALFLNAVTPLSTVIPAFMSYESHWSLDSQLDEAKDELIKISLKNPVFLKEILKVIIQPQKSPNKVIINELKNLESIDALVQELTTYIDTINDDGCRSAAHSLFSKVLSKADTKIITCSNETIETLAKSKKLLDYKDRLWMILKIIKSDNQKFELFINNLVNNEYSFYCIVKLIKDNSEFDDEETLSKYMIKNGILSTKLLSYILSQLLENPYEKDKKTSGFIEKTLESVYSKNKDSFNKLIAGLNNQAYKQLLDLIQDNAILLENVLFVLTSSSVEKKIENIDDLIANFSANQKARYLNLVFKTSGTKENVEKLLDSISKNHTDLFWLLGACENEDLYNQCKNLLSKNHPKAQLSFDEINQLVKKSPSKNKDFSELLKQQIQSFYKDKKFESPDIKQLIELIVTTIQKEKSNEHFSKIIQGLFEILVDNLTAKIVTPESTIPFDKSIVGDNNKHLKSLLHCIHATKNKFASQYLMAAVTFVLKEDPPAHWKTYIDIASGKVDYSIFLQEAFILANFITWLFKTSIEDKSKYLDKIITLCTNKAPSIKNNSMFSQILFPLIKPMIEKNDTHLASLLKLLQISGIKYDNNSKADLFNITTALTEKPEEMALFLKAIGSGTFIANFMSYKLYYRSEIEKHEKAKETVFSSCFKNPAFLTEIFKLYDITDYTNGRKIIDTAKEMQPSLDVIVPSLIAYHNATMYKFSGQEAAHKIFYSILYDIKPENLKCSEKTMDAFINSTILFIPKEDTSTVADKIKEHPELLKILLQRIITEPAVFDFLIKKLLFARNKPYIEAMVKNGILTTGFLAFMLAYIKKDNLWAPEIKNIIAPTLEFIYNKNQKTFTQLIDKLTIEQQYQLLDLIEQNKTLYNSISKIYANGAKIDHYINNILGTIQDSPENINQQINQFFVNMTNDPKYFFGLADLLMHYDEEKQYAKRMIQQGILSTKFLAYILENEEYSEDLKVVINGIFIWAIKHNNQQALTNLIADLNKEQHAKLVKLMEKTPKLQKYVKTISPQI